MNNDRGYATVKVNSPPLCRHADEWVSWRVAGRQQLRTIPVTRCHVEKLKRIGIMTGGGDCPGLNAVIRAVAKTAIHDHGWECMGILDGFLGLIEDCVRPLTADDVSNILTRGGTILGTSNKCDPLRHAVGIDPDGKPIFENVCQKVMATAQRHGIDALVVIGGDGTMSGAASLIELGMKCVGIPKTIDNDLMHTDVTFGFQTAVETAVEALDRVHTTAASHHRIMAVELMGRNAGWLTLHAGIATGSDVILIPEIPYDLEKLCAFCKARKAAGKRSTIVAVAEGARNLEGKMSIDRTIADSPDPIRFGGIAALLNRQLEACTGIEARAVILGHVVRGGTPCAFDRVLSTRFGHYAIDLLLAGKFDQLVVTRDGRMGSVPITSVAHQQRRVPPDSELIRAARSVNTCFGD
jgi:phosphofructokinase-like protein